MTFECFECQMPANVQHHVVPWSLGGRNTVPLCRPCHGKVHSPESSLYLGRLARNSPRGPHKIKESQTREIITMRKNGVPLKEIAARFNISMTHVSYVARGKTRTAKALLKEWYL